MLRSLLSAGLVLVQFSAALALGPAQGPPTQQLVRVDSSGAVVLHSQASMCVIETRTKTVQEKIPVTEEYTEEVSGQTVKKTRTAYKTVQKQVNFAVAKPVFQTELRTANLDQLKAFETDGKPIPPEALKQRLAQETLVVVSANDGMISASYAGLFKPGTIVLALKQLAASPFAPPPPPPAAAIGPPAPRTNEAPVAPAPVAPAPPAAAVPTPNAPPAPVPAPAPAAPRVAPAPAPAPMPADLNKLPSAPQPQFLFASREGADRIRLRRLNEHSYVISGNKVQIQGAEKRMIPVQITWTIQQGEITTISGQDLQCFNAQGSAVALDRASSKLSREGTVLYSADGEPVHPFWLQNVKPSMLVLVGPQLPMSCGMPMMAPMPASPAVMPPATARAPLTAPAAGALAAGSKR
jgi:hypothetical protein